MSAPVSRRSALGGLTLLPLAAVLPSASADTTDTAYRVLTPHQAAVLDAATRRLIPGPDDWLERGHPGAHQANVVRYLDNMLAAFSFWPPEVQAGGPRSNRAGGTEDHPAEFVPLDRVQDYAWRERIAEYQRQYTDGIALLDQQAGGDFTAVSKLQQDLILAQGHAVTFTQLLVGHAIEAMYAVPECGGNQAHEHDHGGAAAHGARRHRSAPAGARRLA